MSNAPVFGMAVHAASLEIFHKAGITKIREKSKKLTAYLEYVINHVQEHHAGISFEIITPKNPDERGAQLSILIKENGKALFDHLTAKGVIADWREPNVIRIAPTPMYNTFEDVYRFVALL